MRVTFIETSLFTREIGGLLSDAELSALQWMLLAQPECGDLIRGSGALRKLRWGAAGRGKRGGIRIIYYWHVARSQHSPSPRLFEGGAGRPHTRSAQGSQVHHRN